MFQCQGTPWGLNGSETQAADYCGLLNSPGRIISIAFDPQNPGTLYVSLDNGDIFGSGDGGRTFQYLAAAERAFYLGPQPRASQNPQLRPLGFVGIP